MKLPELLPHYLLTFSARLSTALTKSIGICISQSSEWGMLKHPIKLRKRGRDYLEALVAKGGLPAKVFKRARGLLELGRGKTLQAVAETLGVSNDTVAA